MKKKNIFILETYSLIFHCLFLQILIIQNLNYLFSVIKKRIAILEQFVTKTVDSNMNIVIL